MDGLKDRSHIAYEQPKSLLEAKTLAQKRETFFNEEHKLKQESRFSFNHTKNNYRDNRERRSYSPYQNNNNQGRRQFSRPNQYQSKNQAAHITEDRKAISLLIATRDSLIKIRKIWISLIKEAR